MERNAGDTYSGKDFRELKERGLGLSPANAPGIDPSTGWFHVHFHAEF